MVSDIFPRMRGVVPKRKVRDLTVSVLGEAPRHLNVAEKFGGVYVGRVGYDTLNG